MDCLHLLIKKLVIMIFLKDEMIFYNDLDDLSEKIYKYKKDDKLRRKIAKKEI